MEDAKLWLEALKTAKEFGVSTVLLFFTFWSIRGVVIWCGTQLLVPVRDSLITDSKAFFRDTSKTLAELATGVGQVRDCLQDLGGLIDHIDRVGCARHEQGGADLPTIPETRIRKP